MALIWTLRWPVKYNYNKNLSPQLVKLTTSTARYEMAEICLRDITKWYGPQEVVKKTNLSIADGEFIVLVGPSGCGKSTTLRMIAGLEAVSSGSINIGPRDVTNMHPKSRNVAMVFQNYALYAHKNVRDNLGFGLKVRGTKKLEINRRVANAAKMLDIEELLDRKPKQLSGGQMQRVALGRALIREPEVFLLDEPLSNLDAKMRVHMREEIAKLHASTGSTMIYVTHDQVEAMTLGNRIAVMNAGKVQQLGPPLEIYDHPANIFVASFIGSPEMNMIKGVFTMQNEQNTISFGEISLSLPNNLMHGITSGDTVIAGLRPEHLTVSKDKNGFNVTVELVEKMGAQTLVVCQAGEEKIRALLDRNDTIVRGENVRLNIKPENIHLFDPESGESHLSAVF